MALSEPLDFLHEFPGWVTEFDPSYRMELSRTAGGRTYVKELGPALWQMAARSQPLRPNALDHWRARLQALENGLVTFRGYALSRTWPILYPDGSWPTGPSFSGLTASVLAIAAARNTIRVDGLPAGFTFSAGDMLTLGERDLHRAMEPATADGSGRTPHFEVRPPVWPDVADVSPGISVRVYRPYCLMALVPGSVATEAGLNGFGSVSFRAIEAR